MPPGPSPATPDPGEELPEGFPLTQWPRVRALVEQAASERRRHAHEERLAWYRERAKQPRLGPTVPFETVRIEFLAMLDLHGNVQAAADLVGIGSPTVRRAVENNPDFAQEVAACMERHRKLLVDEAYRRGIEGYEEPVFWQGCLVGTKTCYSDRLLELLLKARGGPEFRAVAREEAPNISVNVVMVEAYERLEALPRDKREALRALLGPGEGGDVIDVEVREEAPGGTEGN